MMQEILFTEIRVRIKVGQIQNPSLHHDKLGLGFFILKGGFMLFTLSILINVFL